MLPRRRVFCVLRTSKSSLVKEPLVMCVEKLQNGFDSYFCTFDSELSFFSQNADN